MLESCAHDARTAAASLIGGHRQSTVTTVGAESELTTAPNGRTIARMLPFETVTSGGLVYGDPVLVTAKTPL